MDCARPVSKHLRLRPPSSLVLAYQAVRQTSFSLSIRS